MRLYHNPRCSKSRQALALLVERNIEFEDYRYLDKGISQDDLEVLVALEGGAATELLIGKLKDTKSNDAFLKDVAKAK